MTRKRYRVTCAAIRFGYKDKRTGIFRREFCDFDGYRTAASTKEAEAKPCPRCGGHVYAHMIRECA